jgi:hypothetical protein
MTTDKPAACFTIHGLAHLRAALAAGAESGRPVVALSAAGASGFAGAAWFASLIDQGRGEFLDMPLTAILDCGDRAGDVPAALKRGVTHIVFTGHPEAAARLADIAAHYGATILAERPQSCDLLNARDPVRAARAHCAGLGEAPGK